MLEVWKDKGKIHSVCNKTLKPFVDNNSVPKDRANTGIGAVRWGIDQHI
jgi:hypothetical protein